MSPDTLFVFFSLPPKKNLGETQANGQKSLPQTPFLFARPVEFRPEKIFGERRGLKTKVRDLKECYIIFLIVLLFLVRQSIWHVLEKSSFQFYQLIKHRGFYYQHRDLILQATDIFRVLNSHKLTGR